MEAGVEMATLTENDMFRLPDYVDELMGTNGQFTSDGVLLFHVADGSGHGTPLQEFLMKYEEMLEGSMKRLNPICLPQRKDFYGHMSFMSEVIDQEEIVSHTAVLKQPSEYLVSSNNCCIAAMNEKGVSGLLSHYFIKELPAHARSPPQFQPSESQINVRQKAASKSKLLESVQSKLRSKASPADKAAEVSKLLDSPKCRKKEVASFSCCYCRMCVYSDEVLVAEEYSLELKPDLQQTANYYKGKGFFYASGLNVESDERNRVSANFSLSFLNHITLTSLLDGFFPGISSPCLYFGLPHSFFPIHIEDLSLWSVNFVHHGYPKVWIVVPPSSVAKLHYFLSKEFTCFGHSSCIGLLGHKYHLPTPSWLSKNGISFKVVIQKRGQGVIVAPNAAHFGFNLGPNIAEAVNFGSKFWIPYGIVYPKCTCMVGQVHADLSTIIHTFSPKMLEAYRLQKIPKVTRQTHFLKCIVYPYLWKEAFENVDSSDDDMPSPSDGNDFNVCAESDLSSESEGSAGDIMLVSKKGLKRHPRRKALICPVCITEYQGGQKQRLFNHINSAHSTLPEDEKRRVEDRLSAMFPQWGSKLPKKTCVKCGKAKARSMKAHQLSRACKAPR